MFADFKHRDYPVFYQINILNSLKARGVEDVFLFAVDGLKGLPEAIKAVYPEAIVNDKNNFI